MAKEAGKDLRAQLEKGIEIGKGLSGIYADLLKRPEIPVDFWRLLMRNGKQKLIETEVPVRSISSVYTVCGEPLIIFSVRDDLVYVSYRGQKIFQFSGREGYYFFVGRDGVVDFLTHDGMAESSDCDALYYHLLPTTNTEPFRRTKNDSSLKENFSRDFFAKHGPETEWGMNRMFILPETNDRITSSGNGELSQCISHSVGDLQIGIMNCDSKLYQVILGWAEDFKDPAKQK